MTNWWLVSIVVYLALALITFVPSASALFAKVEGKKVKESIDKASKEFDECSFFDEEQKIRLKAHFSRIAGTLVFWKKEAEKYRNFHYYCLLWTIPSAVLIPILTQSISDDVWSKELVTVISSFTALLLAFHRGFKVEDNYKSFRHGESEFYDLWRRLLDIPNSLASDANEQMERYFDETEKIRRFVRNAETNNLATLDEARQMLQGKRPEQPAPPKT